MQRTSGMSSVFQNGPWPKIKIFLAREELLISALLERDGRNGIAVSFLGSP